MGPVKIASITVVPAADGNHDMQGSDHQAAEMVSGGHELPLVTLNQQYCTQHIL